MIGQTIGHYQIIEQIGAGGMGVVYRARDERLHRDVALKVLPPGKLGDDTSRKRFRKEALALAKLSHPNIGTVFDFDTQDNTDFLVMEYITGETLERRLAKGSLPDKESIAIGLQIAAALEEAHEHGIVHQDLKPGNIMVTPKGQVKVLDFGLARRLYMDKDADLTATLTQPEIAGTIPYMAPEQLRGDLVDARTDIFAAGVVLYEMSAGRRPFRNSQAVQLIQQILNDPPQPLQESGVSVAPQLESIILKALDKEPGLRYQSARELRVDLERLSAPRSAPLASSARIPQPTARWKRIWGAHPTAFRLSVLCLVVVVASLWWFAGARPVLPFAPRDWILITDFDNQTNDPLFDRSLLTALTVSIEQSPHTNVVPRPLIVDTLHRMGHTGDEKITEELGREISQRENVRALLSCSIARVGQQYLLTARLIDPQTGAAVRSYSEQAKDQDHILDSLSTVSTRVRRDLGESLLGMRQTDRNLPQVTTHSLQALKMYSDGAAAWDKGQYRAGIQLFESALKFDPNFAMAHAALGGAFYSHMANNPVGGKEHFEKALELSESQHTTERERLYIQTRYAQSLGHVSEAKGRFDAYLASYPDDWGMHFNYAGLLRNDGDFKEALQQYQEVLRLSPNYLTTYIDIATTYKAMGKFAEAIQNYEHAFKLEPNLETSFNINHEYGMAVFARGDETKARQIFAVAVAKPDLKAKGLRSLAWLDFYHGKYSDAKPRLQEALLIDESSKWSLSILREHNLLAMVAGGQGDRAGRMRELDLAAPYLASLGPQIRAYLWVGGQYARAGNITKAADLADKLQTLVDSQNPDQMSDLQTLQAEVELARGNATHAIELLSLADKTKRTPMTVEALGRAYEASGNPEQAIVWYETFVGAAEPPLGWEPQQDWLAARYRLARLYFAKGDTTKATTNLDFLLKAWSDADPGLPLLKDARRLHDEIAKQSK